MAMKLDCIDAKLVGLEKGWAVINTENGGIVAHHASDDCGFAWMIAADELAKALTDIQRTIYAVSPQQHGGKRA
jgi:hypothetical protein